jgi:hypothetical protein
MIGGRGGSAILLIGALACLLGAARSEPAEPRGIFVVSDTARAYTLVLADVPAPEDALREYMEWEKEVRELEERHAQEPFLQPGMCMHPGRPAPVPCRSWGNEFDGEMYYQRPYPVPGFSFIQSGGGGEDLEQLLVPERDVADPGVLRRWREQAEAGKVVECGIMTCRVVYAVSKTAAADTALALCRLHPVGDEHGPPTRCAYLALVGSGGVWIRATVRWNHRWSECSAGEEPGDDWIELVSIEPPVMTIATGGVATEKAVSDRLQARLRTPPLGLASEMINGQIHATAPSRRSQVLPDWREEVAVNVWLYPGYGPGELVVRSSINLLVNRQNTDRDQDWHRPGPGQQSAYSAAVVERFRLAFQDACPGRWRDDFNYVCAGR